MFKYLVISMIFVSGCAGNKATIYRWVDDVKKPIAEVTVERPGKVVFKDKDWQLELDAKQEGFLSGLIKNLEIEQ